MRRFGSRAAADFWRCAQEAVFRALCEALSFSGLQQELRPELAAKLACLDGARKMIAQHTQDPEAYIEAINGIVGDFPRSAASFYGRAIARLAAHGGRCTDALCLAVLLWMPEPEGQAAELSRDVPSDYAYSWLEDLRARVGFAAFRDSLGQHFDGGSPVHQHVVEYTVELVAADLIYNMLLRGANPVHPAVAERLQAAQRRHRRLKLPVQGVQPLPPGNPVRRYTSPA